jgi:hypothetical protein
MLPFLMAASFSLLLFHYKCTEIKKILIQIKLYIYLIHIKCYRSGYHNIYIPFLSMFGTAWNIAHVSSAASVV